MCKTLYEEFTKLNDKHEVSYIALTWISWLLPSTSISDNICCYYSWSTGKPNLHWEVDYNAAILHTNQSFQSWGWPPYYVQRELLRSSEVDCWIKGAIKWNLSSNPSTEYHMTWLDRSVSLTKLNVLAVPTITTDTRQAFDLKYVSVSWHCGLYAAGHHSFGE